MSKMTARAPSQLELGMWSLTTRRRGSFLREPQSRLQLALFLSMLVHALVVVTEWKQFRSPDFARLKSGLADAVVFDGRNMYEPAEVEAAGLAYYGIGRGRSLC